jgi:hypothetical protein
MKTLIICIPSLRLGGAAKIALNLTEYYLEQGIIVHIILTDPHSEDSGFSKMPVGVKIHSLAKINLHHFLLPFVKVFQLKALFKQLQMVYLRCVMMQHPLRRWPGSSMANRVTL